MSQLPAGRRGHITMTTAVNTPHTITNALMIWFSSETDIVRSGSD
jgi:hypothetical protein